MQKAALKRAFEKPWPWLVAAGLVALVLASRFVEIRVGSDWERRFKEFIEGADLLIHDSMYTEEEYAGRSGWGHATFSQALRVAEETGVKRLLFFHHDPTRSDGELDTIVDRVRDEALARGAGLELAAAAEGVNLKLERGNRS